MCFGGSSKSNTAVPPPSTPTTFGYDRPDTQAQQRHNAVIKNTQAPQVDSTTLSQVPQSGASFGADLGTGQ